MKWEYRLGFLISHQLKKKKQESTAVADKEIFANKLNHEQIKTAASLEELKKTVSECTLCALHRTRTQTVFGVGHPAAEWLIIGEAPGADEDHIESFMGGAWASDGEPRQGRPRHQGAGAAGQSQRRGYSACRCARHR